MMDRQTGRQANGPTGKLVAFEGLDQSDKQTQAERLLAAFRAAGHQAEFLTFPAYETAIGIEIEHALRGRRDYQPDTLQLLYIANRFEFRTRILDWLAAGTMVVCDRYLASSVAYGEAQGLDAAWLLGIQRFLPRPDVTVLLDIGPEVAARRKTADRDRFERDYIVRALAAQQGNISRTADLLGVERSNLYRKMRSFGIASPRRGDDEPQM